MVRRLTVLLSGLVLVVGFALAIAPDVSAADDESRLKEAESLRKEAQRKAKNQLNRPDVIDLIVGSHNREVDYYTLSRQIARLAAFIRAFGQTLDPATSAGLGIVGGSGSVTGNTQAVYGPDGPTEKSVRLILEYRLMVTGNPRLAIGKIAEDDERVTAEVVTSDGSLVEVYAIDKKTGTWRPVRSGKP